MANSPQDKLRKNDVKIGDGNPGDKKLSFNNGDVTPPYIKFKDGAKELKFSKTGQEADEVDVSKGDAAYVHVQSVPATVWNIPHPLKKFPSIAILDSAGKEWEGTKEYIDNDNVRVTVAFPFSGKALLN